MLGFRQPRLLGMVEFIFRVGQIAVGSAKGEIRLFDRLGLSRAKTTLPGVGDPIIGMDTTEDGKVLTIADVVYFGDLSIVSVGD